MNLIVYNLVTFVNSMSPIEILVQIEYLKLGLIPFTLNVEEALESLDEKSRNKAKRKFRKIYRKALKSMYITKTGYYDLFGGTSHKPTPKQQANRKKLVYEYICSKITRTS